MAFLESLLVKVGLQLVDWLWVKIEERLEKYFELKSQIKKISNEAESLKEELKGATTDAERFQILKKIADFSDRIGD